MKKEEVKRPRPNGLSDEDQKNLELEIREELIKIGKIIPVKDDGR